MSFSNEMKQELLELQTKKNCCKKAFLLGLIFNARSYDSNQIYVDHLINTVSEKTALLLKTLYSVNCKKEEIKKPGKIYYRIIFKSASLSNILSSIDNDPDCTISEGISFKCQSCEQSFLRGVFLACANLNDPQKGYHLEFSLSNENLSRASKLYRFLSFSGFVSKIVNRKNNVGLYFKNNSVISDLLYFLGAVKSSFEYANTGIEKEIRNNENRATNCVARNIYKSVSASQKHIFAINKLIESCKLDALPAELQETARLRIENEEATLSELASMHNPPISKSGLNHRLEKLCKEAEII